MYKDNPKPSTKYLLDLISEFNRVLDTTSLIKINFIFRNKYLGNGNENMPFTVASKNINAKE